MIKFKKLLCAFIVAFACLGISFSFAACGENEETGETKYDVAIRVECSDGNMYEFPVGTDEVYIEIPYTGRERTYKVARYRLEGCSDLWIDQLDSPFSTRYFTVSILMKQIVKDMKKLKV